MVGSAGPNFDFNIQTPMKVCWAANTYRSYSWKIFMPNRAIAQLETAMMIMPSNYMNGKYLPPSTP
jgi:hypothetical protein